MPSGPDRFSVADLYALSELVATAWSSAGDRDWSVRAGSLEWTCTRTADHAVDCVWAPAFFLASRKRDGYPDVGPDMGLGADAEPGRLVQSLEMATRVLGAVVRDADPDVRAILFRRPEIMVAPPEDFPPRAATELILHAYDVCSGLQVPFEPPAALCRRLRDHTRAWPMWTVGWDGLESTDDPWGDLLTGSDRGRQSPNPRLS